MEPVTEDTSMFEQIEEVKCAIWKLSFVTILSPVRAVKGKGQGYGDCLTCYEEETHMRSGHFWICKFGTVPGIMT